MTTTEYTSKVCTACNTEKPLSDYYTWSSNKKHMPRCKACHRARNNQRPPIPADTTGIEHQNDLISILRRRGLYASPGKSSEYAYADVVVWGCVRIEVKLGEPNGGHMWKFRFTQKQTNGGLVADLIALMCPVGDGYTCYLIEPTCSEFYRDGKFKRALSINTGTHRKNRSDGRRSLSPELLAAHRDNWQVIERKRIEIAEQYQQRAILTAS